MKLTGPPGGIVLCFLLFTNFQARCQWFWQNPLPQGNSLTKIYFYTPQIGFSGGICGTLVKTSNAGQNWIVCKSETFQDIKDIQMVNTLTGFAVGGDYIPDYPQYRPSVILKTNDGGLNWTNLMSDTSGQFYSVHFLDPDTGFVAGNSGRIMKTTDGGQTWDQLASGIQERISSIRFLSPTKGYAAGLKGNLLRTLDGGQSWEQRYVSSLDIDFLYLEFTGTSSGFLCGRYRTTPGYVTDTYIFRTIDQGYSWIQVYCHNGFGMLSADFVNDSIGYVVGSNGILTTYDAGNTWSYQHNLYGEESVSIAFPVCDTGYATWGNEFYWLHSPAITKSTNGGSTWQHLETYLGGWGIFGFDFKNSPTGYAFYPGEVLKTVNAGYSWDSVIDLEDHIYLKSASFLNADYGFLLGSTSSFDGFLYKTIDGGENWTVTQVLSDTAEFGMISVSSYDTIYLGKRCPFGDYLLFRSMDAGVSWNLIHRFEFSDLFLTHLSFPTSTICYGMGYTESPTRMKILKSNDAGITWSVLYQVEMYYPSSLVLLNKDTIFFSCSYNLQSIIVKTFDGGNTFQSIQLPDFGNIKSLTFADTEHGVCLNHNYYSSPGTLFITDDGGLTWTQEWTGSCVGLSTVVMVHPDTLYAGNSLGGILCNAVGTIVGDPPFPEMVIDDKEFILVPNPADDKVTLSFEESPGRMLTIDLYNLLGQPVQHFMTTARSAGDNLITLDVAGLPEGIYIVYLSSEDSQRTSKVIIRH